MKQSQWCACIGQEKGCHFHHLGSDNQKHIYLLHPPLPWREGRLQEVLFLKVTKLDFLSNSLAPPRMNTERTSVLFSGDYSTEYTCEDNNYMYNKGPATEVHLLSYTLLALSTDSTFVVSYSSFCCRWCTVRHLMCCFPTWGMLWSLQLLPRN